MMIDFHTHILPGIDDGAENVESSLAMLEILSSLGIDEVVLTPHFYPMRQSLDDFLSARLKSCEVLIKALESSGNKYPKLHIGAEVYFDNILFNYGDLTPLTLDGGGEYILIELPNENSLRNGVIKGIERLAYNRGLTPIFAHIDRYPFLMNEKNVLKLLDIGCMMQVNITSFQSFLKRIKLKNFIARGYISAFGTDIHGCYEKNLLHDSKKLISFEHLEAVSSASKRIFYK